MKLTARTLVAILVLTGATASTLTSSATTTSSNSKVTATRTSMLPVPTCDPSDPNACGMSRGK